MRLINADALIEKWLCLQGHDFSPSSFVYSIDYAPTVDAVPVVHGEWVYKNRHRKSYRRYTGVDDFGETHTITVLHETDGKEPYCPYCGAQAAESFQNYCPNCGAEMDGKENSNDNQQA